MKHHNLTFTTNEAAIQLPEVKKFFGELVEHYNEHFNKVEQVKKFELLSREWTIESGEMTPKLSMKRKVIMEKFQNNIENIYS
jgi:long-chain acyl-CoA synthetase